MHCSPFSKKSAFRESSVAVACYSKRGSCPVRAYSSPARAFRLRSASRSSGLQHRTACSKSPRLLTVVREDLVKRLPRQTAASHAMHVKHRDAHENADVMQAAGSLQHPGFSPFQPFHRAAGGRRSAREVALQFGDG